MTTLEVSATIPLPLSSRLRSVIRLQMLLQLRIRLCLSHTRLVTLIMIDPTKRSSLLLPTDPASPLMMPQLKALSRKRSPRGSALIAFKRGRSRRGGRSRKRGAKSSSTVSALLQQSRGRSRRGSRSTSSLT